MKNVVFWNIKIPVLTSQETHYISATELCRLMLCKIWGFHGSDYEECHRLGYKNSVRTSQETHYVSAKEPSRLMLCKTWGFYGGEYEECRLLGYKNQVRRARQENISPFSAQQCCTAVPSVLSSTAWNYNMFPFALTFSRIHGDFLTENANNR
jgi:hypothetical protein